jgi:hypothetical protein
MTLRSPNTNKQEMGQEISEKKKRKSPRTEDIMKESDGNGRKAFLLCACARLEMVLREEHKGPPAAMDIGSVTAHGENSEIVHSTIRVEGDDTRSTKT